MFIGKDPCLRQSVHALGDGNKDHAILVHFIVEFGLVNDFLGRSESLNLMYSGCKSGVIK